MIDTSQIKQRHHTRAQHDVEAQTAYCFCLTKTKMAVDIWMDECCQDLTVNGVLMAR